MHDAYDAFWIFRDFRGERTATAKSAPGQAGLLEHVLADATRDGDKLNVVLYYDWACGGTGYKDYGKALDYKKVNARVRLAVPPAGKERMLTLSRANGEGFEVVKTDVKIGAGQKEHQETIELLPATAYSMTIK